MGFQQTKTQTGTYAASPNQQQLAITEQRKPLTEAQKKSQERFFVKCGEFASDIFIGLGLVESDDEEEKKEIKKVKPLKEFKANVNDLMVELNDLMIRYDMQMPKYLDIGVFGLSVAVVFGVPILKKVMSNRGNSKPDYDTKLDDIEVKV